MRILVLRVVALFFFAFINTSIAEHAGEKSSKRVINTDPPQSGATAAQRDCQVTLSTENTGVNFEIRGGTSSENEHNSPAKIMYESLASDAIESPARGQSGYNRNHRRYFKIANGITCEMWVSLKDGRWDHSEYRCHYSFNSNSGNFSRISNR